MSKDEELMMKCIKLAEQSINYNELPFACIIAQNNTIICKSGNKTRKKRDVTAHAEILAMQKAQKLLNTSDLSTCTIYSNCEPCAMCSFVIRELKFKKVVFGVFSSIMGGYSKWKIVQDKELETVKPFFGKRPKIVAGLLEKEAEKIFIRKSSI